MPFMEVETSASYASVRDIPTDTGDVMFVRNEERIERNREAFDAVYHYAKQLTHDLIYAEVWRDASDMCDDPDSPDAEQWRDIIRYRISDMIDGALGCLAAIEGTEGGEHYWSLMIAMDLEEEFGPHD